MTTRTLSDLMLPAPRPWGLRGDKVLFAAMCDALADHPLPTTQSALRSAIETTFEALTGTALAHAPDRLSVEATKRPNGGMSNGVVSPPYWRDTLLPTLIERFNTLGTT